MPAELAERLTLAVDRATHERVGDLLRAHRDAVDHVAELRALQVRHVVRRVEGLPAVQAKVAVAGADHRHGGVVQRRPLRGGRVLLDTGDPLGLAVDVADWRRLRTLSGVRTGTGTERHPGRLDRQVAGVRRHGDVRPCQHKVRAVGDSGGGSDRVGLRGARSHAQDAEPVGVLAVGLQRRSGRGRHLARPHHSTVTEIGVEVGEARRDDHVAVVVGAGRECGRGHVRRRQAGHRHVDVRVDGGSGLQLGGGRAGVGDRRVTLHQRDRLGSAGVGGGPAVRERARLLRRRDDLRRVQADGGVHRRRADSAQDVRRAEPFLERAGDDVVQVGAAGTLTEHRTEVGQAEDAGRDVRRTALRLADDERLTGVDDHTRGRGGDRLSGNGYPC